MREEIFKFDDNSILTLSELSSEFALNENEFVRFWDFHPIRQSIQMYGKDITIKRFQCVLKLPLVNYNEHKNLSLWDTYTEFADIEIEQFNAWFITWIHKVSEYLKKNYSIKLNTAYINWYEDGNASISKHRDAECFPQTSVIGLSFGASRYIRFGKFVSQYTKQIDKNFKPVKFLLRDNSICLMETVDEDLPGFQENYWHEIPKVKHVEEHPYAGTKRISVTLRYL